MHQNSRTLGTSMGANRKYTDDFQVTTGHYFPFEFCIGPNYLKVRVGKKKKAFSEMQVPGRLWRMGLMPSEGAKPRRGLGSWESEGVRVPRGAQRWLSRTPDQSRRGDGSRTGVTREKVRADKSVTLKTKASVPVEFRDECVIDIDS